MAKPSLNRDRAARILADASALGDKKAAEKWSVSEKTVGNYRRRLAADPELSDMFRRLVAEGERSWHAARARALRAVMARIEEVAATEADLDKLSRAAKNMGEVDLTLSALNVGNRDDSEGTAAAEDAVGPARGAEADAKPTAH